MFLATLLMHASDSMIKSEQAQTAQHLGRGSCDLGRATSELAMISHILLRVTPIQSYRVVEGVGWSKKIQETRRVSFSRVTSRWCSAKDLTTAVQNSGE